MGLQSRLFRRDPLLEACLVQDASHVTLGAAGEHVAKIQAALFMLDGTTIARVELEGKRYGPSTAAAVLKYKRARNIINQAYQTKADDIVGKMTIASLDRGMLLRERLPLAPPAYFAHL